MKMICKSIGGVTGDVEISVPGDKSISHRAVIFAAISDGKSIIRNILLAEDVLCTIEAFRKMGVRIDLADGNATVHGVGLYGLKAPDTPLYMGNSGTACRLMMGLLSGQPFRTELEGDESLSKRPMARIVDPLSQMGARIDSTDGKLPITIHPAPNKLTGISYECPVVSAQLSLQSYWLAFTHRGEHRSVRNVGHVTIQSACLPNWAQT